MTTTTTTHEAPTWAVLGLGGGDAPRVLHEAASEHAARAWARDYTARGDWGGWAALAVLDPWGTYCAAWDAPDVLDSDPYLPAAPEPATLAEVLA